MSSKNKKKVLEVITLAGSAEAFIGSQFAFFQANGDYEMHLICSWGERLHDFAQRQNIRYEAVEISRQLSPKKDLVAIWRIAKYIKKHDIDIIVAHYFPKCSLIVTLANMLAGNRCKVIIAHGVLHDTMRGLMRKIVIWEQKFDVAFARKVVCVSPSVARRRREDGIEKADKQVVLGGGSVNGVDTIDKFNPDNVTADEIALLKQKYGITANDFIVGFSGRLVHDKGVEELCGALEILHSRHTNKSIKLLVIGQPETRDALPEATLSFLRNNKNVIMTGKIPYAEIQKYYLLMDILVLPSYREGFPTVVLEASAMDIPVIASKSTGCIDSIDENVNGIYTDIAPESIASQIEKFFDSNFLSSFKYNARQWVVDNYEHTIIRRHMLDVLNSLNDK